MGEGADQTCSYRQYEERKKGQDPSASFARNGGENVEDQGQNDSNDGAADRSQLKVPCPTDAKNIGAEIVSSHDFLNIVRSMEVKRNLSNQREVVSGGRSSKWPS